jgi:hypothetical protein
VAHPADLGQHRLELGRAPGAVGPHRRHDQHRLVVEVRDQAEEQVPRGAVRPLQVLDDQQHRPMRGQVDDEAVQHVHQQDVRVVRPTRPHRVEAPPEQLRDLATLVAEPVPERAEHRPERGRVGDVDRGADQNGGPRLAGVPGQLRDHARLPDPGAPGDERGDRTTRERVAEHVAQCGDRLIPSAKPGKVGRVHGTTIEFGTGVPPPTWP